MELENIIQLPHFKIKGREILFLEQYVFMDFGKNINPKDSFDRKRLIGEGVFIQKRPIERSNISGKNILVLEPHPDDFALSCSGYALDCIKKGNKIKVLNLFSQSSLSTFPWQSLVSITEEEYENLRLEESHLTIEEYLGLGFDSLRLPLALRRGHKNPFEHLNSKDLILENKIYEKIIQELMLYKHSVLLAPLAIQGHIDHLITCNTALKAKKEKPNIDLFFYEDMPYARNRLAYQQRFEEIKSQVNIFPIYVCVSNFVEIMADLASVYKSQFDDINRIQRLAIVKEDARNIASEGRCYHNFQQSDLAQRVWQVGDFK